MDDRPSARLLVPATIENLGDIFDLRRGRIEASVVRRIEVPDAVVRSEVFGLRMPRRLVEELGLVPIQSEFPRPIDLYAVRLTIRGRECSMDVGVIDDDQPVMIGLIALGSMDWVIDAEGGKLIGNPEHGGEEMYDIFSSLTGQSITPLEHP
jgi:hypothetical protein